MDNLKYYNDSFAYNYDIVGIYGIYRKYGSFVGIQLDATGLGKIKL